MAPDARPNITPQLVIGVFIMLLGVVLLLDRTALVNGWQLRPFWPLALMAVGTAMLVQRQDPSGRFWGTVWTVVGGWMLLNRLGWLDVSLWQLIGPMVLIFIGINVLLHTMRRGNGTSVPDQAKTRWGPFGARWEEHVSRLQRTTGGIPPSAAGPASAPAPRPETPIPPPIPESARPQHAIPLQSDPSGSVTLFAALGEAKRASNDRPFRGGEMTAFMGGCVLDLRQATVLPGEQAIINVLAVMGGHEIWVPPGWAVASDIVPIMGGVDDKRLPPVEALPDNAPRLRLRGVVLMGGVAIKN
jgi:hypothetical protein